MEAGTNDNLRQFDLHSGTQSLLPDGRVPVHLALPLSNVTSGSNHSVISFKFIITQVVGYNDGLF